MAMFDNIRIFLDHFLSNKSYLLINGKIHKYDGRYSIDLSPTYPSYFITLSLDGGMAYIITLRQPVVSFDQIVEAFSNIQDASYARDIFESPLYKALNGDATDE